MSLAAGHAHAVQAEALTEACSYSEAIAQHHQAAEAFGTAADHETDDDGAKRALRQLVTFHNRLAADLARKLASLPVAAPARSPAASPSSPSRRHAASSTNSSSSRSSTSPIPSRSSHPTPPFALSPAPVSTRASQTLAKQASERRLMQRHLEFSPSHSGGPAIAERDVSTTTAMEEPDMAVRAGQIEGRSEGMPSQHRSLESTSTSISSTPRARSLPHPKSTATSPSSSTSSASSQSDPAIDNSFALLSTSSSTVRPNTVSGRADPFNRFWNAVEGMLGDHSSPVAFATVPLGSVLVPGPASVATSTSKVRQSDPASPSTTPKPSRPSPSTRHHTVPVSTELHPASVSPTSDSFYLVPPQASSQQPTSKTFEELTLENASLRASLDALANYYATQQQSTVASRPRRPTAAPPAVDAKDERMRALEAEVAALRVENGKQRSKLEKYDRIYASARKKQQVAREKEAATAAAAAGGGQNGSGKE